MFDKCPENDWPVLARGSTFNVGDSDSTGDEVEGIWKCDRGERQEDPPFTYSPGKISPALEGVTEGVILIIGIQGSSDPVRTC